MAIIEGKGLWIWYADQLLPYYQTIEKALDSAVEHGFAFLIPKFSNGYYPWLPNTKGGKYLHRLFDGARERGLKLYPYHYSYSTMNLVSWEIDAVGASLVEYSEVDGLVIDAEEEYKRTNSDNFARELVKGIRKKTDKPVGYSTYRYPSVHQDFPFVTFDEICDFRVPQVYWEAAHNPAYQLEKSYTEYQRLSDKPYYPAGSAYKHGEWQATPEDVDEFDFKAHELMLDAVSWWTWYEALGLNLYDDLCQHDWPVSGIPYMSDKEKLERLWAAHPELHPSDD